MKMVNQSQRVMFCYIVTCNVLKLTLFSGSSRHGKYDAETHERRNLEGNDQNKEIKKKQ